MTRAPIVPLHPDACGARRALLLISLCLGGAAQAAPAATAPAPPGLDAPADHTARAVASCAKIARRYRSVADTRAGEAPLAVLASLADSGVRLSATHVELHSPADLAAWARSQRPPFELSAELSAALDQMFTHVRVPLLEQLPGGHFYSVSTVAGTAGCYESLYFVVDDGRARPSVAPPGFDDARGACGVRRAFGRVDEAPAFFQESYDRSPRMSSDLIVATWSETQVAASCRLGFAFAPRFGAQTLNPWPQTCSAPDCGELRRAAFAVVAEVQQDPRAARLALEARLSAAERAAYDALRAAAVTRGGPTESGAPAVEVPRDPGEITDQRPLQLPYSSPEGVYLLSVGHFTVGWRTFADWSVRFETLAAGKLTEQGVIAVGMTRGALEKTTVAELPGP